MLRRRTYLDHNGIKRSNCTCSKEGRKRQRNKGSFAQHDDEAMIQSYQQHKKDGKLRDQNECIFKQLEANSVPQRMR